MTPREQPLDIVLDVAKRPKHGDDISGDTIEVIERPRGGLSLVLADGGGPGPKAKAISSFVAHKAIDEIANGTKDGMAARAVHDAVYGRYKGAATSSLVILSADIPARTVVVSRNSTGPVLVRTPREIMVYEEDVALLGSVAGLKPNIYSVPMVADAFAIAFTKGVFEAGARRKAPWTTKEILTVVEDAIDVHGAESVARVLLDAAVDADDGKPHDDMAVVAIRIEPGTAGECTRTMTVHCPV